MPPRRTSRRVWEEMARTAFKAHRGYLGLPGAPVEWIDQYAVSDERRKGPASARAAPRRHRRPGLRGLPPAASPISRRLARGCRPTRRRFEAPSVARSEIMIFNIADYGHTLLNDFFIAGGQFRRAEFQAPSQIAALGKKVVINCTGYGARALWKDETLIPVRGQIARLIPQPDVHYGLVYRHVMAVPRRDGIVVQSFDGGDMKGYGDANEMPDRAEAEQAVTTLAELFSPARPRS